MRPKCHFESHLIYRRRYHRQRIFNQSNIMETYVDTNWLCHSIRVLCDSTYMSFEVAVLLFQAHANYETWSIDFWLEG